ncbi:MAG: hypothetical protein M3167_00350 [Acidobacteriota bacterium]|nr:hypothetical protein [Acidobacteriota bacterium]
MTLDRNPKWSELFATLERKPADDTARRELAAAYAHGGYAASAAFFRRRPGSQSNGEVPPLSCSDNPSLIASVRETARQIAQRTESGHHREAIRAAEDAIRHDGPFCPLLVEWAHAILLADLSGETVPRADTEASVRLLITGAEQLHVGPVNMNGGADVYELLSQYFGTHNDDLSRWAAIDLAIAHLDMEPAFRRKPMDATRLRWVDLRRSLEAKLGAGSAESRRDTPSAKRP